MQLFRHYKLYIAVDESVELDTVDHEEFIISCNHQIYLLDLVHELRCRLERNILSSVLI